MGPNYLTAPLNLICKVFSNNPLLQGGVANDMLPRLSKIPWPGWSEQPKKTSPNFLN